MWVDGGLTCCAQRVWSGVCRTLLSRFPEALVVSDLREDVRFKDFPVVVGWPHLRFYAASPLVAATGTRLGTL